MKEVAITIINHLIDNPSDLSVKVETEDGKTTIYLRPHPDDVGKILGRKGRNIEALRTLLGAMSVKNDKKKLILEVVEN